MFGVGVGGSYSIHGLRRVCALVVPPMRGRLASRDCDVLRIYEPEFLGDPRGPRNSTPETLRTPLSQTR